MVRDAGEAANDIIIVRLPNKWFWIIPISAEKTSVGLVIDQAEFAQETGTPQEIFDRWVGSGSAVKERMLNARRVNETRTTSDFSSFNRRLAGDRLLRVGDAAGFMDPIFSPEFFLPCGRASWRPKRSSGRSPPANPAAGRFSKLMRNASGKGLRYYWRMVENYYTTPFMGHFFASDRALPAVLRRHRRARR